MLCESAQPGTVNASCDADGAQRQLMHKPMESISGAFQIAGNILLYPLLSGWRRRWGGSEEERALRLPGDELVAAIDDEDDGGSARRLVHHRPASPF